MKVPFFSVVTPSWQQAAWLEGCIQSVLAQHTEDFEHLVFDNCSSDGTVDILQRHPHIEAHIEPDTGQSNALNKAFRRARGEVICWLNSDDQYLPGTFDVVREAMNKPGVDVVYGDCEEDFCDGRPPHIRKARFADRNDLLIWWEKRTDLLQPAVFFRRSLLDRVGFLREDLHVVMDTELWWRMSAVSEFHYLGVPLARQQRQPESKTIKHMPKIYEEKARVFGPLLEQMQPGRRIRNILAQHVGMGRRWLGLAQSATKSGNCEAASRFCQSALRENPLLIFGPSWWKAFLHRKRSGGPQRTTA